MVPSFFSYRSTQIKDSYQEYLFSGKLPNHYQHQNNTYESNYHLWFKLTPVQLKDAPEVISNSVRYKFTNLVGISE